MKAKRLSKEKNKLCVLVYYANIKGTGVTTDIWNALKGFDWLRKYLNVIDPKMHRAYTKFISDNMNFPHALFPFTRVHTDNPEFVHDVFAHFTRSGMIEFLTETWLKKDAIPWCNTIAESPFVTSVTRMFIYRGPDKAHTKAAITVLLELKLSKMLAMHSLDRDSKPGDEAETFWLIVLIYEMINNKHVRRGVNGPSIPYGWDTGDAQEWNASWFAEAFETQKSCSILKATRKAVAYSIDQAHRYVEMREKVDEVMKTLKVHVRDALMNLQQAQDKQVLMGIVRNLTNEPFTKGWIEVPCQKSDVSSGTGSITIQLPTPSDELLYEFNVKVDQVYRVISIMGEFPCTVIRDTQEPERSVPNSQEVTDPSAQALSAANAITSPDEDDGGGLLWADRELFKLGSLINHGVSETEPVDATGAVAMADRLSTLSGFVGHGSDVAEERTYEHWITEQIEKIKRRCSGDHKKRVRNAVKSIREVQRKAEVFIAYFAVEMLAEKNLGARRTVTTELRSILAEIGEIQEEVDSFLERCAKDGNRIIFIASAAASKILPYFLLYGENIKCSDCGTPIDPEEDKKAGYSDHANSLICGGCALVHSSRETPCTKTLPVIEGLRRSIGAGAGGRDTVGFAKLLPRDTARRVFLSSADLYLPGAMLDEAVDCQLCLEPIQWNGRDMGTGPAFDTCCSGLGYICGDCVVRSRVGPDQRQHDVYYGIARIVKNVRSEIGI